MHSFLGSTVGLALLVGAAIADSPKYNAKSDDKAPLLSNDAWKDVAKTTLGPSEIDRLIAKAQAVEKVTPAALTSDEQFLRRVMLDLTGRLPLPADVTEFVADKDPNKRPALIDKLLGSEDYAKHWARYWRDVFTAKVTNRRSQAIAYHFEAWLLEEFRQNRAWDAMTKEILTASGKLPVRLGQVTEPDAKNGAAYFLLSYQGNDAVNDRTAETARIFLGVQIQCAQCHNHPFDGWKREQFHEMAGYFARVRERPVFEEKRIVGIELVARPFGEHQMPGKDNPNRGTTMSPKFLDGSSVSTRASDQDRRKALADVIANKNNFYFAAAFVNRMWGELMGQAFRQPVDDLGSGQDVVMPDVLARVAAGFAATNFDIKALLRTICNTETYQRQIRPGESSQHLQFAGAYPTRLKADSLWQSLVTVLGSFGPSPSMAAGPFAARFSLEGMFKEEFRYDPSLPADEVEGSIPQALLLMNNPQIQQKLRAQGTNLLGRILNAYPKDDDAVRMVYLRTLARKPTDRERDRALAYIQKVGKRSDAFEDLLWALLNSTEFQTKR